MTFTQSASVLKSLNELSARTSKSLVESTFLAQRQTGELMRVWLNALKATQEQQAQLAVTLQKQTLEAQRLWLLSMRALIPQPAPADPNSVTGVEPIRETEPAVPARPVEMKEQVGTASSVAVVKQPASAMPASSEPITVREAVTVVGREELIAEVAKVTNADTESAALAVEAILNGIVDALGQGEEVRLRDFGTFKVTQTQARTGRNPRTGERLSIPAGQRAVFRPSSQLKDSLE